MQSGSRTTELDTSLDTEKADQTFRQKTHSSVKKLINFISQPISPMLILSALLVSVVHFRYLTQGRGGQIFCMGSG